MSYWGLLDGMSFISLSFIRFMAGFRHERFHKNNNNLNRIGTRLGLGEASASTGLSDNGHVRSETHLQ